MRMMMLLQLHATNDDDEKNFRLFIDMLVNVPDIVDVAALSLS
jgi:hypothetical protein